MVYSWVYLSILLSVENIIPVVRMNKNKYKIHYDDFRV